MCAFCVCLCVWLMPIIYRLQLASACVGTKPLLRVEFEVDKSLPPHLVLDIERTLQVVRIAVSNAIKVAPPTDDVTASDASMSASAARRVWCGVCRALADCVCGCVCGCILRSSSL